MLALHHATNVPALQVFSPGASIVTEHVSASVEGGGIEVALRVQAHAQALGPIQVRWLLASPGIERPWERPVQVSSLQAAEGLPAGDSMLLRWPRTAVIAPRGV